MRKLVMVLAVLAVCSVTFGQEYLLNRSFDDPAPLAGACAGDSQAITDWTMSGAWRRNGDQFVASCSCAADDPAHLTFQGWGNGTGSATQTVSGLPGNVQYELTGVWYLGHADTFGNNTARAELHQGTATGPILDAGAAYVQKIQGSGSTGWVPFSCRGTLPAGQDTITVVIKTTNGGATAFATHVDCCSLHPNQCLTPVDVTGIGPAYGARGAALTGVTISGSGFIAGQTIVTLVKADGPTITATNVAVGGGGTSLTCDLNLTGAALGKYTVKVDNGNPFCQPDVLPNAFNVVLSAFSNTSFELPTAAKQCPVPAGGLGGGGGPSVDDWQAKEIASYGWSNVLFRDSDQYPPTCNPLPDGLDHYGSSVSTNDGAAGAQAWLYQTVVADPSKVYTFSGQFAGGGNNKVTIELLDGDELGSVIASTVVRDGGSTMDWTPKFVTGQPTGNLMTVMWHIDPNGAGPHAAHADALALNACGNATFKATGVLPTEVENNGVRSLTITGESFNVSGSTPQVALVNDPLHPNPSRGSISATNVHVVNDTTMTCDVDLTGASTGQWDILVTQDGCIGRISDYASLLVVVGTGFVNGDFELADAGPVNCGTAVLGLPQGWAGDTEGGGFDRDSSVHQPATCPSPVGSGGGGHYGSLTLGSLGSAATRQMFGYQTVRVTPGASYTFSGYFAGAGENDVYIALFDGTDYFSFPHNYTLVRMHSRGLDPVEAYDWTYAEVKTLEGGAPSNIMTVAWYMDVFAVDTPSASHADGLTFGLPCNSPVQDVDGDGDVDLTDFGVFQTCFNGPNRPYGLPVGFDANCKCLDVDEDTDLDLTDFGKFQTCFNGPNRPPACP